MNSIVTEGYLEKKSRHLGSSRKRWCVLRGKWLLTYKQKQIYKDPTEQFDLTIYDQILYPDSPKFILVSTIKNMKRREFIAQSYHEMIHWVDNIQSVYRNLKHIKKYPHILHHMKKEKIERRISQLVYVYIRSNTYNLVIPVEIMSLVDTFCNRFSDEQQLKCMPIRLASLGSSIQDKENIIENLSLRYDLGFLKQDSNRLGGNLAPDEIEIQELTRKAEALKQRNILENSELRENVNEIRDENAHVKNEIYELQDTINREILQMNKLEKLKKSDKEESAEPLDSFGNNEQMDNDNDKIETNLYGNLPTEVIEQELKYMKDHLASLRSLMEDKENIIQNLVLRYDLDNKIIITQDSNRQGGNVGPDEVEMEELRRTCLENFELRGMVNELRDLNFWLRNEIIELEDKLKRIYNEINKLSQKL